MRLEVPGQHRRGDVDEPVRVASRRAHGLGDRDPVVVHELEPRRLEDSRVRGRAEVRDAEARTLLVGERRDLQRRREPASLHAPGDRDPGEDAERPVEAACVGDGVEVRAEDERRLLRLAETAQHVAGRVAADRQSRLLHPARDELARAAERLGREAPREAPGLLADGGERVGAGEKLGGRAVHGVRR